MIKSTHFITNILPTNDGYTWTLASRLSCILQEIEDKFGERDKLWTFVGIEFEKNGPQNWFPGNCGNVAIQLNINALDDDVLACYQLAHEAIHLLAPDGQRGAPVIEEGLATMYSEDFVLQEFNVSNLTDIDSYKSAVQCVRELLDFEPDAIKKLRKVEPSFKKMSSDTFTEANLNYPQEKIHFLLSTFVRQ